MTAPSIEEIHPASSAEGVVLSDTIHIIFDQEVDRTTVQILLEGPDTDRWSGPEQVRWDDPDTDADDDVLASPGYKGMVPGTVTFDKVDGDGNGVSAFDYTGGGAEWRAKAILTPTEPLAANTEYRVWVVGDEETGDNIISGVSTRTVFDTVRGANLGDGVVIFSGGYTGTNAEDGYTIRIKEAGDSSDKLLFQYWRTSSPLVVRELRTSLRSQLLNDGVFVIFSGEHEIDDEFSVVVQVGERMQSTYTWVFTTGSGSILAVPDDVEQSPSVPVGGWEGDSPSSTTEFTVLETIPVLRATHLDPLTIEEVIIQFSADLDESTVTDDTVTIWTEPVNGDADRIDAEGELAKTLSISDDILTIAITDAGDEDTPILVNNAVFVTLHYSIADTDGNTLGTDYEMYFTTTYTPYWASVRRIRLDLGALIVDVPDDTINLAIFEASLEAQALSFGFRSSTVSSVATFFAFARRQYVTCTAEAILLGAISGSSSAEGGGKSKRLADLQVNFGSGGQFKNLLERALGCRVKWEATLTSAAETGPGTSQKPSMVIKGRYDPDRPEFGREWEPVSTHSGIGSEYPAANIKSKNSVYYRRWRANFLGNRWGSRFVSGD